PLLPRPDQTYADRCSQPDRRPIVFLSAMNKRCDTTQLAQMGFTKCDTGAPGIKFLDPVSGPPARPEVPVLPGATAAPGAPDLIETDRLAKSLHQERKKVLPVGNHVHLAGHPELDLAAQLPPTNLIALQGDPHEVYCLLPPLRHPRVRRDETDGPVQRAVAL